MIDDTDRRVRKRRRPRWWAVAVLALLWAAILIVLLPWVVAVTPLRHAVVAQLLDNPHFGVKVQAASFGWLAPPKINGLTLTHLHDDTVIEVAELTTRKTLLHLWWSAPHLGTIEIRQPTVNLVLDRELFEPLPDKPVPPPPSPLTLTAVITDAAVAVRPAYRDEAVVNFCDLNLVARVEHSAMGRDLVVNPVTLLDHHQLTRQMCRQGIHLAAPALADATVVQGRATLRLDQFRLPLQEPDKEEAARRARIDGVVQLEGVTADIHTPAMKKVLRLVARALGQQVPETIRIADHTQVTFRFRQGRVHHEGLAFVLPEISPDVIVRTSGNVGIDESLDMLVQFTVPFTLVRDSPLSRQISNYPFTVRVTGTLDQPKVELPEDRGWLRQFASALSSGGATDDPSLARALADVVGTLVEGAAGNLAGESTPLLDRIRQLRRARQDEQRQSANPDRGETVLDRLRRRRQEWGDARPRGQPSADGMDASERRGWLSRRRPTAG